MCEVCEKCGINWCGSDELSNADLMKYHAVYGDHRSSWSGFEGRRHSEETRAIMSVAQSGHPVMPETRRKISERLTGRKLSKTHVENMSKTRQGKPAAWLNGENRDAVCKKISDARSGVPMSQEQKAKISNSLKGRPATPEQKARISQKGKKFTQEHKDKLSLARKEYWKKRRVLEG